MLMPPKEISGLIIDLFEMYNSAILYCHEKDAKIYSEKLIKAYDKSKEMYDLSQLEPIYQECKRYKESKETKEETIREVMRTEKTSIEKIIYLEDYIND